MKLRALLGVIGTFLSIFPTKAQETRTLQIGDTVPDLVLHNVINYKDSVIRLSDFKDKLVILDFWATWCTSCIVTFPHNKEMAAHYRDKIQILNVGFEPKEKITKFLSGLESRRGDSYRITTTTDDSLLSKLFPHKLIPHLVWIGKNGVVLAITDASQLTRDNIDAALRQKDLHTKRKKDVDPNKPLYLSEDFNQMDSLVGYSVLYKGKDINTGKTQYERTLGGNTIGKLVTQFSLLEMYKVMARPIFAARGQKICDQRVIVNIPKEGAKQLNDIYCFDMVVAQNKYDSLYEYAIEELNRLTGFHAQVRKQRMKCLVLKNVSGVPFPYHKGSDRISRLLFDCKETYIRGYPLQMLVDRLNELPTVTIPVVDGTRTKDKVDVTLSGSNELMDIRRDLGEYGLSLVEEEREIDALVITKDKGNP